MMTPINCSSCGQSFIGTLTEEGCCPLCGALPGAQAAPSKECELAKSLRKQPLGAKAKCGIASLVCGIIALAYPAGITGPIGAAAALILGALGIKSEKRGFAIGGVVLACVALGVFALLTYLEYQNRQMMNEIFGDVGQ